MLNYDAKFKYLSSINPFDGTQKRKIYGGGEALRWKFLQRQHGVDPVIYISDSEEANAGTISWQ
jgi:hypothetical protein